MTVAGGPWVDTANSSGTGSGSEPQRDTTNVAVGRVPQLETTARQLG